MLKKLDGHSPLNKALKFFFSDIIVLYVALIMSSIMYHYRSSLALIYGMSAVVIAAVSFRLFDYIAKHRFIGTFAYITYFAAFLSAAKGCVTLGGEITTINFGIWFLTPQDILEYNKWYTLAMFLLFMVFMVSVVYYFTRIRYRIFMNFLIFLIPFAIYGKEYQKMPTVYIMLLAIGYVVVMINCRQLSGDDKTVIVDRVPLWVSAGVYVVAFASVAAIIPKPAVEADREILENLISAEEFTDKLVRSLSIFDDTTSSEQFRSLSDEAVFYIAKADEPLRLKARTFSEYDFSSDKWEVSESDTHFLFGTDEKEISFPQSGELLEAIALAAEKSSVFSETYGLEELSADSITIPETHDFRIISSETDTQFAPVPPNLVSLDRSSYKDTIEYIRSGLVYCKDSMFSGDESFSFTYSGDFFITDENISQAEYLSQDNYRNLIYAAYQILKFDEPDKAQILLDEYNKTEDFENYLDYGRNKKLYELAEKITEDCESDYEKAKAIESYFAVNGFVYDLDYQKADGENALDFLFNVKRGVCYEFATSMTLLARAAGIPARYTEGYNMYENYTNTHYGTNYIIKGKSAHGFPELYIRGVGWTSFEPTVSTSFGDTLKTSATSRLSSAGLILLAAQLAVLIFALLYPSISHKIFLMRIKSKEPRTAIIMIMHRICRIYRIDPSLTSNEAANAVKAKSGCDISCIAQEFDRIVYGETVPKGSTVEEVTKIYINAYSAERELHKKSRKRSYRTGG